jgi:hypothetical protein
VVNGGADAASKSLLELRCTIKPAKEVVELAPRFAVIGRGGDVEALCDGVGVIDDEDNAMNSDRSEEGSPSLPRGDLRSKCVAVGLHELRDLVVGFDCSADEPRAVFAPMMVLGSVKPAKTPTKPMTGIL